MWESMLIFGSVFASGVWVGLLAPLIWQDCVEWRRRSPVHKPEDADDAADQQPEG